jgi:uncharacterized cupredoxin-like copper-binding protein
MSSRVAVLIGVSALASCTSRPAPRQSNAPLTTTAPDQPVSSASIPLVTVTATDYAFQAPPTLPAGLTTFYLVNHGHELHMLSLTKLEGAHTIAELLPILARNEPQPAWAVDLGGPNAVPPGDTANATTTLVPGRYALICWVPGTDGLMHVLKGMVAPLEVTGVPGNSTPEPTADVLIKLADYHIEVSGHATSGRHIFWVENEGPHEHDVEVLKLAPGRSMDEGLRWFNDGSPAPGPPAARVLGGMVGLPPGGHGFFTADLGPGTYVLLCLVPDEKDGKPHYQHGMARQITVR